MELAAMVADMTTSVCQEEKESLAFGPQPERIWKINLTILSSTGRTDWLIAQTNLSASNRPFNKTHFLSFSFNLRSHSMTSIQTNQTAPNGDKEDSTPNVFSADE